MKIMEKIRGIYDKIKIKRKISKFKERRA